MMELKFHSPSEREHAFERLEWANGWFHVGAANRVRHVSPRLIHDWPMPPFEFLGPTELVKPSVAAGWGPSIVRRTKPPRNRSRSN